MSLTTPACERMRKDALAIFRAGLDAVDPKECILRRARREKNILKIGPHTYDLDQFEKIYVIGAGKAGASMASAVETLLADRISDGIVIVKYGHTEPLKKVALVEAGHPIPDASGVAGAKKLMALAQKAQENTLVICLISGGGSALMTLPAKGLTLADKQEATRALLGCGATIHEINTIRKHLSQIKAGQLAKAVFPAQMICLVVSDVVGDDLDIIASGPAVADPGTFLHCHTIIETYGIRDSLPEAVLDRIDRGMITASMETPKKGDPVFDHISHMIVASNFDALSAGLKKAEELGYHTLLLSSMIEGETRDVATVHAGIAKQILATGHPIPVPACVLSGGETTVVLKGPGKGGRNQEFSLAAAMGIKGVPNIVILSAGTDGTDGPTDAAGAMVDHLTYQRALDLNLVPEVFLEENNAYTFFDLTSDLIKTGPTNTNVMDFRLILARS